MSHIEGSRITPESVFTEEYWGETSEGVAQLNFVGLSPRLLLAATLALRQGTVDTALDETSGVVLPQGAIFDVNNPEATGAQNLSASVLLVDGEVKRPFDTFTDRGLPERPKVIGQLTCSPRSLIKAATEVSEDGKKVVVQPGQVSFTNGEDTYIRTARVVGVVSDNRNVRAPVEHRQVTLKHRRDGLLHMVGRKSLARVVTEFMYRHEIGGTMTLPGGILSRVNLVEVLAAGQPVEARQTHASQARFLFNRR